MDLQMNNYKLASRVFIVLAFLSGLSEMGIGMILFAILSIVFWIIGMKDKKKVIKK